MRISISFFRWFIILIAILFFGFHPSISMAYDLSLQAKIDGLSVPDEMLKHALFDYYGGNLKLVKEAISKGANVNDKLHEYYDDTFFMLPFNTTGIVEYKFDVFKYLISHGADLNARNKYGETVLMLAAMDCNEEAVDYLLSKKPDVNAKTNIGYTALMYVIRTDCPVGSRERIIQALLEHGADVNIKDNKGETAISFAATYYPCLIPYFIEAGGSINVKNLNGNPAVLDLCFCDNYAGMIKFAVAYGKADVNAKSYYGKTLLLCAVRRDNFELVKYLVSKGAKICIRGENNDYNPFYAAAQKAENGDDEIFKYFIEKLHLTKKNVKLNRCVSNSVDMQFLKKYLKD